MISMLLSLPRWVYVAIAAVLLVFGIYRWGHHVGWTDRDVEMQAEIARMNEQAREVERTMTSKLNDKAAKLQEANHAIDEKQSALDRAIRAGRVRFPAPSCVQASAGAAAPAGDRNEAASESDRETLAAIAAIVAQGDRNTEQLNACIDAYNEVRSQLNGQR